MKIVIINYGAGNIQSIKFAIQRLGYTAILSDDVATIQSADRVIFPGVGEASSAMEKLKATGLDKLIPTLKQPVLGICLGMQLMCNFCEEGNTKGLGIFDVDVVKFDNREKVPQIGWNQIENLKLVHSFYVPLNDEAIAVTEYGIKYASALQEKNFYGVQFHPEKSSVAGEQILKNFLEL